MKKPGVSWKSLVPAVALITIAVAWFWPDDNGVYCPLKSSSTRRIVFPAYLKLDNNNVPEYIEVRRKNMLKNYWRRSEDVLFRAYGAEDVRMINHIDGMQFEVYSDTASGVPDAVFVIDVMRKHESFDIHL